MANMRQQSKGREKERDILGDTPSQFWLLSRRNFGYFPAVWLISRLAVHFPTRFWLISPRWEFGFWSRVEGNMSRVEGNISRVLKNENKIIKIKRKTSLGFGLYANKSVNVPLVHDKTNK